MTAVFYIAAAVAVVATALVITRLSAVHALLYLIVSLLAVAVIFYALGAPFVAALEVVVYAGAIMVLFVFVVMMLNFGPEPIRREALWLKPGMLIGPAILTAILGAEFLYVLAAGGGASAGMVVVGPEVVGASLFTTYLFGVELAAMMLLSGLIGAIHIGRRGAKERVESALEQPTLRRYVGAGEKE